MRMLESSRRKQKGQKEMGILKKSQRDVMLPPLKVVEEDINEGVRLTSRSWRRQEDRFNPNTSGKECGLAGGLIVAQHATADSQYFTLLHWWCFKTPNLW